MSSLRVSGGQYFYRTDRSSQRESTETLKSHGVGSELGSGTLPVFKETTGVTRGVKHRDRTYTLGDSLRRQTFVSTSPGRRRVSRTTVDATLVYGVRWDLLGRLGTTGGGGRGDSGTGRSRPSVETVGRTPVGSTLETLHSDLRSLGPAHLKIKISTVV